MPKIFKMKNNRLTHIKSIQYLIVFAIILLFSQCKDPASLNALIVSDLEENVNKDIKTILLNTGLFDATITNSKSPDFEGYDVVVLNLAKANWSEKTQTEFTDYVSKGGGVVVLGSSLSALDKSPSINKMLGVKVEGAVEKSNDPFEYQVVNSKTKHPVTDGLQPKWMHAKDYLVLNPETVDGAVDILATAWADTLQGGNGAFVPVILSAPYEGGRVFISTLGSGSSKDNATPLRCVGYITTLQRGAEWAATGVVSQEASIDFPNSVSTHEWIEYKPLTVDQILERAALYEIGKSKKSLTDFSMRVRNCDGKPDTYAMYELKILEFLDSEATVDSKKYMCRELSWMGSENSIPVLEKLINDKDLKASASYALQRLRM